MKLYYNDVLVADITANHSMTIEEALYVHGYDIASQEDLKQAYADGEPWVYCDDLYNVDIDGFYFEM